MSPFEFIRQPVGQSMLVARWLARPLIAQLATAETAARSAGICNARRQVATCLSQRFDDAARISALDNKPQTAAFFLSANERIIEQTEKDADDGSVILELQAIQSTVEAAESVIGLQKLPVRSLE